MSKYLRKTLSFLLLLLVLGGSFLSLPYPVKAVDINSSLCDIIRELNLIPDDVPWFNQDICTYSDKVYDQPNDEMFGERYTYAQVGWIINSLILHTPFVGSWFRHGFITMITDLWSTVISSTPEKNIDWAKYGLPGMLMGSMSYMYDNPPASGVKTVKQTLAKLNLIQPAHAQGFGFDSLSAVNSLWSASRNSAYMLMVVLLIASGFMIMFRTKISPQSTVTLQLLIPRIIVTLVGVTFSYAIAGFVIDMVYVALTLVVSAFSASGILDLTNTLTFFTTRGFGSLALYYIITLFIMTFLFMISITGAIASIGTLIMVIIILFLLFKVWFMLLKSYLMLLVLVIAGPWYIVMGLLPSSKMGIGSWIRAMIAQASVFVVVPIMFLLNMIIWQMPTFGGGFDPASLIAAVLAAVMAIWNLLGGAVPAITLPAGGELPSLPLFQGGGTLTYLGIGYAILALTPKAAELVRDALKIPPFKYGSAFGEALGPAIDMATRPLDYAAKNATSAGEYNLNAGLSDFLKNVRRGSV